MAKYRPTDGLSGDGATTIGPASSVYGRGAGPHHVLEWTGGGTAEEDISYPMGRTLDDAVVTRLPRNADWGDGTLTVQATYKFVPTSPAFPLGGTHCRGRVSVKNLTTNTTQYYYTPPNTTGATITSTVTIPASAFQPNTTYFLVAEAEVYGGDFPNGGKVDGDYTQFYILTDRTPDQPVITAPPNGYSLIWGDGGGLDEVSLTWSHTDPDEFDSGPAWDQDDYCGFEVQFRRAPSPLEPDPPWYTNTSTEGPFYPTRNYDSMLFRDYKYEGFGFSSNGADIRLRGSDIDGGVGKVHLPGPGTYQFRVRVFDDNGREIHSGPYTMPTFQTIPEQTYSISEWSDVSHINVIAAWLPPTLISPVNNVAQQVDEVAFRWNFRDPRVTGGTQYARQVRIREVGDDAWAELIPVPPPVIFAADTFTRANSPTTLGSAETGGAWTAHSGTWGIDTNRAYVATGVAGGYSSATLDTGVSNANATVEVTIHTMSANGSAGLRVRTFNSGNGGFAVFNNRMVNVSTGAQVGPAFSATFVSGDRMRVVLDGSDITVYRQAGATGAWVQVMTTTSSTYLTNYRHGLIIHDTTATTARFDNFIISALDVDAEPSASGEYVWTNGDGFTLVAGHQYEWQVRTIATPGNHDTNWNGDTGRFWAIPEPGSGTVIPVPDITIPDPGLGCGVNRVFVYARGGVNRLGEITNIAQVSWARVRDDISECVVRIRGWSDDCGQLLAALRCWQMELVVFRDNGTGPQRVWEGPVTRITYEKDSVEVAAHDCMAYVYRRVLRIGFNDAFRADGGGLTTVTRRSAWIIQNALSYDDPNMLAYLQVIERADDARNSRVVAEYSTTAWQQIDDFAAKGGLDDVTVGRKIILWDTHNAIGSLPEMRDSDFGTPPIVTEYGMQLANFYAVTNNNGVWGSAHRLGPDGWPEYYGWIEMLSSAYGESDEAGAATPEVLTPEARLRLIETLSEQAERNIANRHPAPLVARVPDNSTLNPEINVGINQLIPGVHIPLRSDATLRQVTQMQKLDRVEVNQTDKGEQITVTLSPAPRDSATDPDAGEEIPA